MSMNNVNRETFHLMKKIIDKIEGLEDNVRSLNAQQTAGQYSYDTSVIGADFTHQHMPSSILSGNMPAAINFTTRPTYNGADVVVDGDPVGLQADDDATRLGVDADTAVTTGTKVLHTQLVGPLGKTPFITLATSDSDPNLDADPLLGTHALLSARKDANTTIGLSAVDGTYNALHVAITDGAQTMAVDNLVAAYASVGLPAGHTIAHLYVKNGAFQDPVYAVNPYTSLANSVTTLKAAVLTHGEDLDVGAGNSEPIKILAATSDSVPNLDGLKIQANHSLLSARKDAATTLGVTLTDGTYNPLHMRMTDGEELQTTGKYAVTMEIENIAASQDFILIDKSDTTNFPHTSATGIVHITILDVEVDPDSSFVGDIELGFLENVDGTDGDYHVMKEWHMEKRADLIEDFVNLIGDPFKCSSTYHLTNAISLNDAAFQTDVALSSPYDDAVAYTTVSGDGDIALRITMSAGSADLSIEVKYYVA